MSITHIAGVDLTVSGVHIRQRCSWCGHVLIDCDLTRIAVAMSPTGPVQDVDARPGTWKIGALVRVDGYVSMTVEPEMGETGEQNKLPGDACALLPPEMTLGDDAGL